MKCRITKSPFFMIVVCMFLSGCAYSQAVRARDECRNEEAALMQDTAALRSEADSFLASINEWEADLKALYAELSNEQIDLLKQYNNYRNTESGRAFAQSLSDEQLRQWMATDKRAGQLLAERDRLDRERTQLECRSTELDRRKRAVNAYFASLSQSFSSASPTIYMGYNMPSADNDASEQRDMWAQHETEQYQRQMEYQMRELNQNLESINKSLAPSHHKTFTPLFGR